MTATSFRTNTVYLRAAGYMLLSTAGFSAMSVCVRLMGPMDAALIVTLRNAVTLLLILPFVYARRFALVRTTRLKDHALRGALGSIGMITWTYCLTIMPLTHATALSFTAPLFATLFAIIFLKERAGAARWLSLMIGLCGTLIILRPSPHAFEWSSLLVMGATTSWAITGLFVKSLSRTEPPLRIVFYMNLFMFLIALPFGAVHWQWPSAQQWLVLVLIAISSLVMHLSMARAYSLASVVSLLPLDFTRMVYTSLFAWIIFGEVSDRWTWLGAAIIVASAAFMARRDAKALPVEP